MFTLLLIVPVTLPAVGQRLRIPVRILDPTGQRSSHQKQDFQLLINEKEREIIRFEYCEKSMGVIPELKRHFVLSFQIQEFKTATISRITYIITELLNPGDRLILVSPLKIYQFNVPENKEKLLGTCNSLLAQDFHQYHQKRNSARKQLFNRIRKLKAVYQRPESFKGPFVISINFLSAYPAEFKTYKNQYLIPNPSLFQKVSDILISSEGEKWWVHLHDHETYGIFFQTIEIVNEINRYVSNTNWRNQGMPTTITTKLNQFKQHLSLKNTFPQKQIQNSLLKGNMSLCFLIFSPTRDVAAHTSSVVMSDLESVWKKISRVSGGIILNASNPAQEMARLKNHVDSYYEIDFKFHGRIEPKTISLLSLSRNPIETAYPDRFSALEVKTLIELHSIKKVTVSDFSRDRNRLDFRIHSFQINPMRESNRFYGLLNVIISLADSNNTIVHSSNKILRASNENPEISLSLPEHLTGRHLLKIRIIDLLANRQTCFTREIDLDRP